MQERKRALEPAAARGTPEPGQGPAPAAGLPPEELLARAAWVRALAARLAADVHAAEDLAQETLLVAARRGPEAGVPLEPWLARVARNLLLGARRDARRRRAREAQAARSESDGQADPADLIARLEAHRVLIDAVRSLEEPYRGALLLRWFEGLPPRAIARRTGVPLRTVHTRLHRGLARLRAALDRPGGPPLAAWLPLLGPLPAPAAPPPVRPLPGAPASGTLTPFLGGLLVHAKTKLLVGAAACAGLFLAVRAALPPVPAAPAAAARLDRAGAELARPAAAPAAAPAPVLAAERRAVPAAAEAAPDPPELAPASPAAALVVGRAVDLEGRPAAGLRVGLLGADPHREATAPLAAALTRADGGFVLELPAGERAEEGHPEGDGGPTAGGRLTVLDQGWRAVFEPALDATPGGAGPLLVVAPAIALAGRVIDEQGLGVPGAELLVALPAEVRERFDAALDHSVQRSWGTHSDAEGAFALDAVAAPSARLHTTAGGRLPDVRAAPQRSESALEIVLRTPASDGERLVGTVVDATGLPVEGARVALGWATARTGPEGRFVLTFQPRGADDLLRALAPGRLPAVLAPHGDDPRAAGAWPDPLVLQLGGPPLALGGRVLDGAGRPAPGLEVQLLGATEFGPVEVPGRKDMTMQAFAETLLGDGPGGPGGLFAVTDAGGRFELGGLLERDYRLRVVDRARPAWADFGPLAAGTAGLELRMPPARTRPRLAGRVLSLSGTPVPGLGLRALVPVEGPTSPGELGGVIGGLIVPVAEDGTFELLDVSLDATQLELHGPAVGFGHRLDLPPGADPERLELRVPVLCRFRVELDDPHAAQAEVELLDGDGRPLLLTRTEGDLGFTTERTHLAGGRSTQLSAPETAATLVVHLADGERLERPVRLLPGELNRIGP